MILINGMVVGSITVLAVIFLVEKSPKSVKSFIFGHYLLSDILGTMFALMILPVNGITSLMAAASFCLIFTLYLSFRRNTYPWKRFDIKKLRIEKRN